MTNGFCQHMQVEFIYNLKQSQDQIKLLINEKKALIAVNQALTRQNNMLVQLLRCSSDPKDVAIADLVASLNAHGICCLHLCCKVQQTLMPKYEFFCIQIYDFITIKHSLSTFDTLIFLTN